LLVEPMAFRMQMTIFQVDAPDRQEGQSIHRLGS
jgi:hypothetical protein